MIKRYRTNLQNGLPLVVVEIPHSNSAIVSFWTKAGARIDPEGKAGLAHFMEHLLLKKSKKYPTDLKLANSLEEFGAWKNGTTYKDRLNLSISSAAKDIDKTIDILFEIVFRPLIDQKSFDSEKEIIFKKQIRKQSRPEDLVWDIWASVFYSPSPLTRPVIGDKSSINNISLKDTLRYWDKYFKSNNSLLFISGGVNNSEVLKKTNVNFDKVELKKPLDLPKYSYQRSQTVIVQSLKLPQTNMLLSFRFPGIQDSEYFSLIVLRNILGVGWSSRISQRLRVKESLIYSWGTSVKKYQDTGALIISLATETNKFSNMTSIISEEIAKLCEKGINDNELKLTFGNIEGRLLANIETSADYMDWYAIDELLRPNDSIDINGFLREIKKITVEDVNNVAKKYLTNENWHLAAVGDIKEEDINFKI